MVRLLSVVTRALFLPVNALLASTVRMQRRWFHPRYDIVGGCTGCGQCCHRLLLAERPFLTWPVLKTITRFWIERIHPFTITQNAVQDPDTGEFHRILLCKSRVDGRCADYLLRPRACREWPWSSTSDPPVLFSACGFRVVDRQTNCECDVALRRPVQPDGARGLVRRWTKSNPPDPNPG